MIYFILFIFLLIIYLVVRFVIFTDHYDVATQKVYVSPNWEQLEKHLPQTYKEGFVLLLHPFKWTFEDMFPELGGL